MSLYKHSFGAKNNEDKDEEEIRRKVFQQKAMSMDFDEVNNKEIFIREIAICNYIIFKYYIHVKNFVKLFLVIVICFCLQDDLDDHAMGAKVTDMSFRSDKFLRVTTETASRNPDQTMQEVTSVKCPKAQKEYFTVIKNVKQVGKIGRPISNFSFVLF